MIDVCRIYGFDIQRGNFICCPFHNEKTPSLKLYDGNRGFYCFGCGEHGSVIDFIIKYYGLSFKEAITKLNNDFNLGFPIEGKIDKRKQIDYALQAYRMRNEQKRQRDRAESLVNALDSALDKVEVLERKKREKAPQRAEQPITDEYASICVELDFARLEVENAERELYEYRSSNN